MSQKARITRVSCLTRLRMARSYIALRYQPLPIAANHSDCCRRQWERTQREDADFASYVGFLANFAPKCRKFAEIRRICFISAPKPPSTHQSNHNLCGFAPPAVPNGCTFRGFPLPSAQCERTQREDADFAFHAGFLADFAPKCRKFTQFREICAIPAQKPPSMRQSTHNLRGFALPAAPAAVSHGKTSPGSRKNSKICQIPSPETLSTRNTVRHPASRSHRSARSGLARLS